MLRNHQVFLLKKMPPSWVRVECPSGQAPQFCPSGSIWMPLYRHISIQGLCIVIFCFWFSLRIIIASFLGLRISRSRFRRLRYKIIQHLRFVSLPLIYQPISASICPFVTSFSSLIHSLRKYVINNKLEIIITLLRSNLIHDKM